MDYQKSYVLMWVGIIAGFILAAVGGALAIKWLAAMGTLILLAYCRRSCSSAAPTAANSGIPAAAFPTTVRSAGSTSGKMFP